MAAGIIKKIWLSLLIVILSVSLSFAEPLLNKEYSFKDFTGISFKNKPVEDFNNTLIKGSCFYQEASKGDNEVLKDIFPNGIVGVIFQRCNLDNVEISLGNIIQSDCINRKIQVQNDGDDWFLDEDLKPVEPMNKEQRLMDGQSIDPKDIPAEGEGI